MRSMSVALKCIILLVIPAAAIALWWFAPPWIESLLPGLDKALQEFWTRPYSSLGSFGLTVTFLVRTVVFLTLIWFFTKLVSTVIRTKILDKTALDEGRKFSLQRVVTYLLFGIGTLAALHALGVNLSSITVFSGALGIGLGLGFQTIAKNFASGLILLVEQPVKVGDRVEVDGLLGDIMHIGSRGTWIQTNDNVVMIVPNSEFIEGRVTNWTANDRDVRINVPLGVSYESDPEHVRSVLLQVARDHPDVLNRPPPDVVFTGFGDSALDFELRVWTSKQVTTPKIIASDLYFKVFASFNDEGIEIPFPQRDLHVRSVSPSIPAWSGDTSGGTEVQRAPDTLARD